MRLRLLAIAALFVACLAHPPTGLAQIGPDDPLGRGTQRGIQQMNASGQVGTITLFRRDPKTMVAIEMEGVSSGAVETVEIVRSKSCENPAGMEHAYALTDLHDRRSRTLVDVPAAKLLSGNYSVVLRSKADPGHLFACGHLF